MRGRMKESPMGKKATMKEAVFGKKATDSSAKAMQKVGGRGSKGKR